MLKYSKSVIRQLKREGYSNREIEHTRQMEEEVDGWKQKAYEKTKDMTPEEYHNSLVKDLRRFGYRLTKAGKLRKIKNPHRPSAAKPTAAAAPKTKTTPTVKPSKPTTKAAPAKKPKPTALKPASKAIPKAATKPKSAKAKPSKPAKKIKK